MDKKNYEEIAKIIKPYLYFFSTDIKNKFCNELADYFEREDEKNIAVFGKDKLEFKGDFNKKQFLKYFGVQ